VAKVFILEDDPQRIKIFRVKLAQHELFFTDEVEEAIDTFKALGPFDYYFLDHDLGGQIYVDSEEKNTGYQFAKFLSKQDIENATIIIHSLNGAGAKNMLAVLPTAQYHPFTQLKNTLNG